MKRVNIKCPYCGSRAFLRPASVVYGAKAINPAAPYYVCARYPACDAYVAAHKDTRLPMGTLADKNLRCKRIEAHKAFNRLWESRRTAGSRPAWPCRNRRPISAGFPHSAASR